MKQIMQLIIFIVCLQYFYSLLIFAQAVRKFNFILGKMTANIKKNMRMATSQEAAEIQYVMLTLHFCSLLLYLELFTCS